MLTMFTTTLPQPQPSFLTVTLMMYQWRVRKWLIGFAEKTSCRQQTWCSLKRWLHPCRNSSNIYVMKPRKGPTQDRFYSPRYCIFSTAISNRTFGSYIQSVGVIQDLHSIVKENWRLSSYLERARLYRRLWRFFIMQMMILRTSIHLRPMIPPSQNPSAS